MRHVTTLIAVVGFCLLGLPGWAGAQPAGKWEVQASGVEDHLKDVTFVSNQVGWAVGARNTILHTADGGKTWRRQVERNDRGPNFHRVLFTGPKTGWVHTDILGAIRHTTDGGATWKDVPLPEKGDSGSSFCRVAVVGDGLVLQYSVVVYRTADAGKSWQKLTDKFPADSLSHGDLWFADAATGCAVIAPDRVALTADGGKTWREGRLGKEATGPNVRIQFADPKTGWALPHYGTLHATTDSGQTWEPRDLGHRRSHPLLDLHFADARLGHVLGLGNNVIGEVRRTTDGGKTWALLGKLRNPSYVNSLSFPDADHGWVVGDKGYIEHYRGPGAK